MTTYHKVLDLLTPKEKRRGLLIFFIVTLMALLEVAGVASVMPFLSVMGNPEIVESNQILAALFDSLDFKSREHFLLILGGAAFAMVLISSIFRIFAHYAMNRFIEMRRHSISERLLETYLRQPYSFFLDRHTGDMAKGILSEVDQLAGNVLRPGIQAMAYAVVAAAMLSLLVVIDPLLAFAIATFIGFFYALIYGVVRGLLGRIGRERADANRKRFTTAGEALGGIKAIKLLGQEHAYLSRFRPASARFARHIATNATLGIAPKFLIEAVAIGGVLALAIFLMATRQDVGDILSVLGVYAFAGYKLLPAIQNIYNGVAKLRFGGAAVDDIHADMHRRAVLAEIRRRDFGRFTPCREIALDNISFIYPNATKPAIDQIDLKIPVGNTIGIVGETGAGKTTLVDIILGLLWPTTGSVAIDGEPITDQNLRIWQQTLGYVPQEIFLSDASVEENIAFGVPKEEIDHRAVERAAWMAQIHEFIITELADGYATKVGERGVRLSGGQRQRIGIARALYHDPEVLLFDEATSALDNATERAVMEAVRNLHDQKTIVLIAHRLTTVEGCDQIYFLERGRVSGSGTYEELLASNHSFQKMAVSTN